MKSLCRRLDRLEETAARTDSTRALRIASDWARFTIGYPRPATPPPRDDEEFWLGHENWRDMVWAIVDSEDTYPVGEGADDPPDTGSNRGS